MDNIKTTEDTSKQALLYVFVCFDVLLEANKNINQICLMYSCGQDEDVHVHVGVGVGVNVTIGVLILYYIS